MSFKKPISRAVFYKLKPLNIADIHIFQTVIFMYKFWINTIPLAFRNIFFYNIYILILHDTHPIFI